MVYTLVLSIAAVAVTVLAQQTPPAGFDYGECVTKRIVFNPDRIYTLKTEAERYTVDRSKYDLTLDYGNVDYVPGGVNLNLQKPTSPGGLSQGARFSTTQYMRYAKITGRFRPVAKSGAITTLITWSERQKAIPGSSEMIQDEIDWEVVGTHPTDPQYNLFTVKSKALERAMHGGPSGAKITPNATHDFFIDWRNDRVDWGIDGRVVRSITRAQSRSKTSASGMGPNDPWFPESTSRVQFSVWDGSGVGSWAGGPIPFNERAKVSAFYEYIDIQCYDDNNKPVARFTAAELPLSQGPIAANSSALSTNTTFLAPVSTTLTSATATVSATTQPQNSKSSAVAKSLNAGFVGLMSVCVALLL
ncbi:hypothetical protein O5D80_003218 [Batrachochytrium dendrobatidis]|nr:hypothetical protein O5D80_003218 [Batrachochytrium dendrobatidis]